MSSPSRTPSPILSKEEEDFLNDYLLKSGVDPDHMAWSVFNCQRYSPSLGLVISEVHQASDCMGHRDTGVSDSNVQSLKSSKSTEIGALEFDNSGVADVTGNENLSGQQPADYAMHSPAVLSVPFSSAKQALDQIGQIEQEGWNYYVAPSEAHSGNAGDAPMNFNVAPAPSMPSPGPGSTESTHETQTVGSLEEPQAKAIVVTEELKVAAKLMQDIHIQLFGQSKKRYKYLHRFIIVLLLMANKKLQPKNALLARLVKFCDANKADCDPPDPNSIVRQIVHFCFLPDGTGDVGILWALFKGCKDRSTGCYSFTRITDAINRSQQNSKAEHFLPVKTAGRGNGKLKLLYRFGRDALTDLAAAVKVLGADGRDVGYDGLTEPIPFEPAETIKPRLDADSSTTCNSAPACVKRENNDDNGTGPPCPKTRRMNDGSVAPSVAHL